MDKDTKCIFVDHGNAYLKLGPFKYERLNKEPEVGYIHELISADQCNQMQMDALGKMKSTPYTNTGVYETFSRKRTSKVMYINEKLNANAMKISQNMELATNTILSRNQFDSENFQVKLHLCYVYYGVTLPVVILIGNELWYGWLYFSSYR